MSRRNVTSSSSTLMDWDEWMIVHHRLPINELFVCNAIEICRR